LRVVLRSAEPASSDGHRASDDGAACGTLVAEQLRRESTAAVPEYALLRAILVQALRDVRCVGRRTALDAEAWFADTDVGWPCSFENVCAALDLDADSLRRRVGIPPYRNEHRAAISRPRRTAATSR
jgi:hypothetical protein